MKKIIIILLAFMTFGVVQSLQAKAPGSDPVYIKTITTPDKSIDMILGIYPKTYKWDESLEASQLTLSVLNQAKEELAWENYKVYILLKDNTLIYNYTTKAADGEYSCTYKVDPEGVLHEQVVCFSKKFDIKEIKSVWVAFDSNLFFELSYYKD